GEHLAVEEPLPVFRDPHRLVHVQLRVLAGALDLVGLKAGELFGSLLDRDLRGRIERQELEQVSLQLRLDTRSGRGRSLSGGLRLGRQASGKETSQDQQGTQSECTRFHRLPFKQVWPTGSVAGPFVADSGTR